LHRTAADEGEQEKALKLLFSRCCGCCRCVTNVTLAAFVSANTLICYNNHKNKGFGACRRNGYHPRLPPTLATRIIMLVDGLPTSISRQQNQ